MGDAYGLIDFDEIVRPPNLWDLELNLEIAVFLLVCLAPLLMELFLHVSWSDGYYQPGSNEIDLSIGQDHPAYDRVKFHEEMHRELFSQSGVLPAYVLFFAGGCWLMLVGLFTLQPKLWFIGAISYWGIARLGVELHAILLTGLEFGTFHIEYLAFLLIQFGVALAATPWIIRLKRSY